MDFILEMIDTDNFFIGVMSWDWIVEIVSLEMNGLECIKIYCTNHISCPSASHFKSFSRWLEHFFLTEGQNNFGNKIPLPHGNSV